MLDEDGEEDIATALWQQEFKHITYRAIDPLDDIPLFDLASCTIQPDQTPEQEPATRNEEPTDIDLNPAECRKEEATDPGDCREEGAGFNAGLITLASRDLWALTSKERAQLNREVIQEDKNDHIEDVIDRSHHSPCTGY